MKKSLIAFVAGLAALSGPTVACAYDAGDWLARVGTHYVDPKRDNNDTVNVDGAFGLTGSVEYFITRQFAVDLLLAVPFKHDINLNGGGEVATAHDLPPVLSLVWYPQVEEVLGQRWHPFIGAGLNYTFFFDESTSGALAGAKLHLDDSVGIAGLAGLSVDVGHNWSVVADVRYMDIDTKAKVNGASIGDVEIDPLAYGLSVGYRF